MADELKFRVSFELGDVSALEKGVKEAVESSKVNPVDIAKLKSELNAVLKDFNLNDIETAGFKARISQIAREVKDGFNLQEEARRFRQELSQALPGRNQGLSFVQSQIAEIDKLRSSGVAAYDQILKKVNQIADVNYNDLNTQKIANQLLKDRGLNYVKTLEAEQRLRAGTSAKDIVTSKASLDPLIIAEKEKARLEKEARQAEQLAIKEKARSEKALAGPEISAFQRQLTNQLKFQGLDDKTNASVSKFIKDIPKKIEISVDVNGRAVLQNKDQIQREFDKLISKAQPARVDLSSKVSELTLKIKELQKAQVDEFKAGKSLEGSYERILRLTTEIARITKDDANARKSAASVLSQQGLSLQNQIDVNRQKRSGQTAEQIAVSTPNLQPVFREIEKVKKEINSLNASTKSKIEFNVDPRNISKASADLKNLKVEIDAVKKQRVAIQAFVSNEQALTQIANLRQATESLLFPLGAISAALTGIGVTGVKNFAELQDYQFTLNAVLKDNVVAADTLANAINFAAKTPFNVREVVESTVLLTAYQTEASKTLDLSSKLAAGLNKPLNETSLALGKAFSGSLEGFEQLRNTYGITSQSLREAGANVNLNNQIIVRSTQDLAKARTALDKIINQRFGNVLDERAKTLTVAFSNLQDTIFTTLAALARPFAPAITSGINLLNSLLKELAVVAESPIGRLTVLTGTMSALASVSFLGVASFGQFLTSLIQAGLGLRGLALAQGTVLASATLTTTAIQAETTALSGLGLAVGRILSFINPLNIALVGLTATIGGLGYYAYEQAKLAEEGFANLDTRIRDVGKASELSRERIQNLAKVAKDLENVRPGAESAGVLNRAGLGDSASLIVRNENAQQSLKGLEKEAVAYRVIIEETEKYLEKRKELNKIIASGTGGNRGNTAVTTEAREATAELKNLEEGYKQIVEFTARWSKAQSTANAVIKDPVNALQRISKLYEQINLRIGQQKTEVESTNKAIKAGQESQSIDQLTKEAKARYEISRLLLLSEEEIRKAGQEYLDILNKQVDIDRLRRNQFKGISPELEAIIRERQSLIKELQVKPTVRFEVDRTGIDNLKNAVSEGIASPDDYKKLVSMYNEVARYARTLSYVDNKKMSQELLEVQKNIVSLKLRFNLDDFKERLETALQSANSETEKLKITQSFIKGISDAIASKDVDRKDALKEINDLKREELALQTSIQNKTNELRDRVSEGRRGIAENALRDVQSRLSENGDPELAKKAGKIRQEIFKEDLKNLQIQKAEELKAVEDNEEQKLLVEKIYKDKGIQLLQDYRLEQKQILDQIKADRDGLKDEDGQPYGLEEFFKRQNEFLKLPKTNQAAPERLPSLNTLIPSLGTPQSTVNQVFNVNVDAGPNVDRVIRQFGNELSKELTNRNLLEGRQR